MIPLTNTYGRPFDDLDALKAHITARELAAQAGATSYSVVAEDGTPLCGFVAAEGGPRADFIAKGWNCSACATTGSTS